MEMSQERSLLSKPHGLGKPGGRTVRDGFERVITEVGIDFRCPGLLVTEDLADEEQWSAVSNSEAREAVSEVV